MSDTPRTDFALTYRPFAESEAYVTKDFARQLERELNEANRLLDLARRHPYIPNSLAQILNEPHKR